MRALPVGEKWREAELFCGAVQCGGQHLECLHPPSAAMTLSCSGIPKMKGNGALAMSTCEIGSTGMVV